MFKIILELFYENVLTTTSILVYSKGKDALSQNKISYQTESYSNSRISPLVDSPFRGISDSFGADSARAYTYNIYVKKAQKEYAEFCLSKVEY